MGHSTPRTLFVAAAALLVSSIPSVIADLAVLNIQDARPFLTFLPYDDLTKSQIVNSVYDTITQAYVNLQWKNDTLCQFLPSIPDCYARVDATARLDRLMEVWPTRTEYGFHVGISNILYDLKDYHLAYFNPYPMRCMLA
ncbi:hypothetical protein HK102_012578, partial [Quaeritorhiza haematococci]